MKIAALSDIHGNLAALDAVLDDVRRRGADVIVNLGDILSGALHPPETADRLIALDLPTIKGNHERQLLTGDRESMRLSDRWAHDTLRADHLEWIAALPERMTLDDDVLMVHGTPDSDLVYFLETVTPDGCRAATPDEIAQRAGDEPASLILCGHTHLPRTAGSTTAGWSSTRAASGCRPTWTTCRIRTASRRPPHARYAMVSRTAAGWNVEFHAVEYDWHTAAATAASRGRDDWTVALRTGRC